MTKKIFTVSKVCHSHQQFFTVTIKIGHQDFSQSPKTFVTLYLDVQEKQGGSKDCNHEFRSTQAGGSYGTQEHALETPKDVFLFGRGRRLLYFYSEHILSLILKIWWVNIQEYIL